MILRAHLDVYRATLFASLGLAAGCGGQGVAPEASAEDSAEPTPEIVLPPHLRCTGDTPLAEGLLQCENGIIHRTEVPGALCADCTTGSPVFDGYTVGYDTQLLDAPGVPACATDADCEPGTFCVATSVRSAPVNCGTGEPLRYSTVFACQTPEDECGADAQCEDSEICAVRGEARECMAAVACAVPGPVPGRPFLIAARPRLAGSVARSDWCGGQDRALADDAVRPLADDTLRALAAEHWTAAALMEHASIAAFARFTLQLLELGAPFELVHASQEAMRDETEHARACFALAARYAGAPLGPGALDTSGALEDESFAELLGCTFREGCVGETVAALVASEALALARDAEVRQTLALIARDEQRHAELAFRFVRWALQVDTTGEARRRLQSEIARLRAERDAPELTACAVASAGNAALAHHGVPAPGSERPLRLAAIRSVVLPCAEALLAAASDDAPLAVSSSAERA